MPDIHRSQRASFAIGFFTAFAGLCLLCREERSLLFGQLGLAVWALGAAGAGVFATAIRDRESCIARRWGLTPFVGLAVVAAVFSPGVAAYHPLFALDLITFLIPPLLGFWLGCAAGATALLPAAADSTNGLRSAGARN